MSAVPVRLAPRPAPRPAPRRTRPQLRIIALQRTERARAPYFATLAAILVLATLAALGLHTSMATTSYTIRDRSAELIALQQQREALATQVQQVSAPATVMARASELGLVPGEGVTYLRLSDRTLIGGP